MNRARIAVKREHDRSVATEELDESARRACRAGARARDARRHQVDDVDDAHRDSGRALAEPRCGRKSLNVGMSPAAGQNDVGLFADLPCRPIPYRAPRARVLSPLDVEPLELRLLVDNDEVDVVSATLGNDRRLRGEKLASGGR